MFKIEVAGIQLGFLLCFVTWFVYVTRGTARNSQRPNYLKATLVCVVAFPFVSVLSMFAVEPWYIYGGSVSGVRDWNETWVILPENTVNVSFQKTLPGGAFHGMTDRASWEAWRIKYGMVNETNWDQPTHSVASQFPMIDFKSGEWVGYITEVTERGGARQTWFRESDGTVVYEANGW